MLVTIIQHAVFITSFVLIMMLLIEYINVQSRGRWQALLQKNRYTQYLAGVFLGIMPGCLGAFMVVSLYSHRVVSFGTLVAAMIATSGDEAFVMLSLFPVDAIYLNAILFIVALLCAFLVDIVFKNQDGFLPLQSHMFELHDEKVCRCFYGKEIIEHLKSISSLRISLITFFGIFLAAILSNQLGMDLWDWKKITFTLGAALSLFIVITVPDHFLEQHIYKHVIKQHLLRIFLWTFGALLLVSYIGDIVSLKEWLKENDLIILIAAALVGVIPESGPHLIFSTMYADQLIPFAVLLASSISQDGHGTIPLLAVSIRAFIWLKFINVVVAIMIGILFLLIISINNYN